MRTSTCAKTHIVTWLALSQLVVLLMRARISAATHVISRNSRTNTRKQHYVNMFCTDSLRVYVAFRPNSKSATFALQHRSRMLGRHGSRVLDPPFICPLSTCRRANVWRQARIDSHKKGRKGADLNLSGSKSGDPTPKISFLLCPNLRFKCPLSMLPVLEGCLQSQQPRVLGGFAFHGQPLRVRV